MSRDRGTSGQKGELPYRPCVGVMLLNRDGLVFVGRRKSEAGGEHVADGYAWQMPQGGIDPGETPYEAALRELYEETNIRTVSLLAEAPEWYAYDLPPIVAGRAWKGRYRGQTQKWFAFRFEGDGRRCTSPNRYRSVSCSASRCPRWRSPGRPSVRSATSTSTRITATSRST